MGLDIIKKQLTIAEAMENEKRDLADRIAYAHNQYHDAVRNIELTYQGLALLDGAGFDVKPISKYSARGIDIDVTQKDLPRVYKAIGRLRLDYKYLDNGKKGVMKVVLRSTDYPSITVSYAKKLARRGKKAEGQKCQIKRIVRPRRVEYDLVCDI